MSRDDEAKLLEAFRALGAQDRHALLVFASFLAQRGNVRAKVVENHEDPVADPQPEARPTDETVVMAIKRLTRTYPMLDRRKLMGPTSLLMSQHTLQGRAAAEVIDELELVFERHYQDTARR